MAKVTLPVSMEDEEIFPAQGFGLSQSEKFDPAVFKQMLSQLDKMWWSRLVTACRGYVANGVTQDDHLIFCIDDAFLFLHRSLVEEEPSVALQTMDDIQVLERSGLEVLKALEDGSKVPQANNPFFRPESKDELDRLFGPPGDHTYSQAFKQGFCFVIFFNMVCRLCGRWREKAGKKKSVKFSEDPEWQPDHRVVIFQQFYQGNRTWILTDYDRHIILYWRPFGVKTIFGERYLQSKLDDGFKLCSYCGLLESQPKEFQPCPYCKPPELSKSPVQVFCSKGCEELHWGQHRDTHPTVPSPTTITT